MARLDEIIYYKPLAVFILIGINDIFDDHANRKDITPKYVANNIKLIARKIKSKSRQSKIFIQTILPVDTVKFMNFHLFYQSILKIFLRKIIYHQSN